jgi:hypothetical protein
MSATRAAGCVDIGARERDEHRTSGVGEHVAVGVDGADGAAIAGHRLAYVRLALGVGRVDGLVILLVLVPVVLDAGCLR